MVEERLIISHVRESDKEIQTNDEHQQGVAKIAESFAAEFGMGDFGKVMGLLHDKGKEKIAFQQHIIKESGINPSIRIEGDYCHAYVGALLACKQYQTLASLLAYPIMGHHAGLYDYSDYDDVIEGKIIPTEVDTTELNLHLSTSKLKSIKPFECNHIIRMLFSCLVDADRLDTEAFMSPEQASLRKGKKTLQDLAPLLEKHLAKLKCSIRENHKESNRVNIIRNQVQDECRKKAVCEPGFYSLTVPTGGGKTLSSLVWAMNHAIHHSKKRIVIAIPYTSIIVQTAQVLRDIFGKENVLEHHSNVSYESFCDKDDNDENKLVQQMKLATENWDYPIIVTTNVQLFESMYSNKPTPCRKLHNLCNSVLILDEVQVLPTQYLQPIVNALKTYQRLFGLSVLFTTASQPVLEGKIEDAFSRIKLDGIDRITEIIPIEFDLHNKLRRVNLFFDDNESSYDEIADRMLQYDRVLCIVNTRKTALEIYNRLPKDEHSLTIHLSRMMCQHHIRETIERIKSALNDSKYKIIRVVSTQLIEAGVDIDFPVVFRQEAGLDSIIQSAGRCNREGVLEKGDTYVFMLKETRLRGTLNLMNEARKDVMDIVEDKMSPDAIYKYFNKLYQSTPTFDKSNEEGYNMHEMLEDVMDEIPSTRNAMPSIDFLFKMAANNFHLIDDDSIGVVVPYVTDEEKKKGCKPYIEKLIEELKTAVLSYRLMKELGPYMINIKEHDYNVLEGYLIKVNGVNVLDYEYMYSQETGLRMSFDEILIK